MSRIFLPFNTKSLALWMLPLIGACSSAGQLVTSTVDGASSYYGTDSFSLVATSPANFGLVSKAQYAPEAGQTCKVYSPGLGGEVSRRHQKTDEIDIKDVEQTATFNIPLSYHVAGCRMELKRVELSIEARYGPSSLDIAGDVGGISIVSNASPSENDSATTANFRGVCTWMFQLSEARIQKDGISKVLSCSAASSDWTVPSDYMERSKIGGSIQKSKLNNSKVTVDFRVAAEEEPSMDNRWVKTVKGWKPCQGTEKSNRCQTPPSFKSFKMNGRECTVYPACTE
ncbi:hypothetical protein [Pseudomonas fluorescens]|uniref:hypothetical protein n=1 Tax=Pseudomonas fluorescens TaxID=294 RepID=UPI00126A6615|nr:hypothetical protein [Pseudomonas fluorescens]